MTIIKRHPLVQGVGAKKGKSKKEFLSTYLCKPLSHPVKLKFSDERFSFNFADSVIKKKELNELE